MADMMKRWKIACSAAHFCLSDDVAAALRSWYSSDQIVVLGCFESACRRVYLGLETACIAVQPCFVSAAASICVTALACEPVCWYYDGVLTCIQVLGLQ